MLLSVDQFLFVVRYPQLSEKLLQQRCEKWLPHLLAAMEKYSINTPQRVAHFIAQIAHESGRFAYVRELWGPTPAQLKYEGRADLGNSEPGDGFRFRGRGLLQITGRANYRVCGDALGIPLLLNPEVLERPDVAALASAWWWQAHGLNALADSGDIVRATKKINGGTNGIDERRMLTARALQIMGVGEP